MSKISLSLIVAMDKNNGIGKNGVMPWQLKNDLIFFQKITSTTLDHSKKNAVIMGRTTWESIPVAHRPLLNRTNFVLSRNMEYKATGATVYSNLEDVLNNLSDEIEKVFIIGGGSLYKQTINRADIDKIYITRINHEYNCDTFFPEIPANFNQITSLGKVEEGVNYEYLLYSKK